MAMRVKMVFFIVLMILLQRYEIVQSSEFRVQSFFACGLGDTEEVMVMAGRGGGKNMWDFAAIY